MRRLSPLLVLALTLTASAAVAGPRHSRDHRISAVHVLAHGTGSHIVVELAGGRLPRLLVADDKIAALAIADIDNDGNLDILAASERHGLLVWRNAGRGRFVLATTIPRRVHRPRAGGGLRATYHPDGATQFGDDRYTAVLPRAPETGSWLLVSESPLVFSPAIRAHVHPRHLGRAPPPVHA